MKYQTTTTKHTRGTPIRIFGANLHLLVIVLSDHCVYNEDCRTIFLFKYLLQQFILIIKMTL